MKPFWKDIGPGKWTLYGGLLFLFAQAVVAVDLFLVPGPSPWLSLWFFGSALIVLLVLVYRKLIINYTEANDGFAQVEALFYLHSRIKPRKALPRMRSYAISPDFANLMLDLVLEEKPAVIVECGAGISTLVNGYALEQSGAGHVYALEHDAAFFRQAEKEVLRHGLEKWATVIHAPLGPVLLNGGHWKWYSEQGWKDLPGIDLLIVDGPPALIQPHSRYPALPLLAGKLNPGAIVLVDDCIRREDRESVMMWMSEFPGWDLEWVPTEKKAALLRRRPGTG